MTTKPKIISDRSREISAAAHMLRKIPNPKHRRKLEEAKALPMDWKANRGK